MKRYMLVTPDSLAKLQKCFSSSQELEDFALQLKEWGEEVGFNFQVMSRMEDDQAGIILLRQICMYTIFVRQNMELTQQLVANLELTECVGEE